jgi:hypothetical protein
MGNPSATEAMNGAIERARALLFPARLEKWLALGFIAFLAGLGESGGSYSFRWPFPGGSPPSGSPKSTAPEKIFGESWRDALAWAGEHTGLVIALGSGMLLLGVALAVLLIWLSSRGKLMFVESVIHDRYQVKEPWERLREPAWAIFKFRLILGIIGLSVVTIALGSGAAIALDELKTGDFGTKSIAGGLVAGGILFLTAFPLALVSMLLDDFVIPLFYLRGGTLRSAWALVQSQMIANNTGPLVLFYLLKMLMGVGFALLATMTACVTCCVAALPYVSSVVLLPAHVFFRSYSLLFLQQLGERVFPDRAPPPAWPDYPQRFGS